MRTHQLTLVNAVQPTPTINVLRPRNAILVFSASPQMTFNSSSGVVLQVRWSSTSSRICFRPSNPSVGSLRKPERRSHDGVHNCSNVGVVSCSAQWPLARFKQVASLFNVTVLESESSFDSPQSPWLFPQYSTTASRRRSRMRPLCLFRSAYTRTNCFLAKHHNTITETISSYSSIGPSTRLDEDK